MCYKVWSQLSSHFVSMSVDIHLSIHFEQWLIWVPLISRYSFWKRVGNKNKTQDVYQNN
jgi:hypothetical protein